MAKDLFELADKIENYTDRVEKSASDCAKNAAIAIITNLAQNTPVDTTQALSSWIVTLDSASSLRNPPHVFGRHGSTKSESAKIMIDLGIKALQPKMPNQDIYIVNNQHYVVYLNQGTSIQQPAGFVERATLVGTQILRNFKV